MNGNSNKIIKCFSCNADVPDIKGEVHRYMDASPGCWKMFGELLELEYSDIEYAKNKRITVDAYAVQHYGKASSPQAVKSVNHHLISLYFIYEKNYDVKTADRAFKELSKYKTEHFWLTPPKNLGQITVSDVAKAKSAKEHCELVYKWGKSAWLAWKEHHKIIKEFVEKHYD